LARIRSVKPEFFASEDVSALPLRARLTWIGLWTQCDDHGRTKDQVKLIKAAVWPLDNVALRDVEDDLAVLADRGRIVRYVVGEDRFLAVVKWHYHQKPNRPGAPKFPAPPVGIPTPAPGEDGHCAPCYAHYIAHGTLTESSVPVDNSIVDITAGHSPMGGFTDDSLNSHGGLTPGGERRGGERRGDTRASAPPPPHRPRCPRHTHLPDDDPGPNCRDCRDARLAEERNDAAVERALRHAIRACRLCDGDGWRWINPQRRSLGVRSGPTARCDHQPAQLNDDQAGQP
jgi:hypothetical protein